MLETAGIWFKGQVRKKESADKDGTEEKWTRGDSMTKMCLRWQIILTNVETRHISGD